MAEESTELLLNENILGWIEAKKPQQVQSAICSTYKNINVKRNKCSELLTLTRYSRPLHSCAQLDMCAQRREKYEEKTTHVYFFGYVVMCMSV